MACAGCLSRQRKLIEWVCKKPESRLCRLAKKRLAKMLEETK